MRRFTCLLAVVVGLLPIFAQAGTPAAIPLPAVMAVTLQRHDAGTFYVQGAIEGYGELDLLVDTGASYLVINQTILD
jgi:predicted aspartyl protease